VEFNEAIAVNVDVETFDMDGIAKAGVGAFKKGGAMRFETYVSTGINKAESGGSGRKGSDVCGGGAILGSGVINRRAVAGGGGRIGVAPCTPRHFHQPPRHVPFQVLRAWYGFSTSLSRASLTFFLTAYEDIIRCTSLINRTESNEVM
jgi:hypothetical protein